MISNKGSRPITVNDFDFRWKVSGNGRQHLVIYRTIDEQQIVVVVNYPKHTHVSITPKHVKQYIEKALHAGWSTSMPRIEFEEEVV